MFNFIGLIIIIIIGLSVKSLRNKINKSDNSALKGLIKIGDTLILIRFLLFIPFLLILLILLILFTMSKSN